MKIEIYTIDAFTDTRFSGNPAAVCMLKSPLPDHLMQSVANEMNLSETAFVSPGNSDEEFNIRYFTPMVEVGFCGHATLASAKVLLTKFQKMNVVFTTADGLKISASAEDDFIIMNFPIYDTSPYKGTREIYDAFGIDEPVNVRFCPDLDLMLIEIRNKKVLEDIDPDYAAAISALDAVKLLVVTCKSSNSDFDFYSRCFCPWIGINEDPVTGAAHTVLAKYWGDILNKSEMKAFQLSKRGGFMDLRIIGDSQLEVKSQAVIVLQGEMII